MCIECSFVLAPFGELNTSRIALNIQLNEPSQSINGKGITGHTGTADEKEISIALVVDKNSSLPVNNSRCHISTLEVYRGRHQAFKISHGGFNLSDNSTIEVTQLYVLFFMILKPIFKFTDLCRTTSL